MRVCSGARAREVMLGVGMRVRGGGSHHSTLGSEELATTTPEFPVSCHLGSGSFSLACSLALSRSPLSLALSLARSISQSPLCNSFNHPCSNIRVNV